MYTLYLWFSKFRAFQGFRSLRLALGVCFRLFFKDVLSTVSQLET